jgi:hypothetical protein
MRRRYRSRRYRDYDYGHERARQHIEEARQFTEEMGGADADVKQYLFSLSDRELTQILDAYEARHGKPARDYARTTIRKWKDGRVQMSGDTAKRIFDLLPPRMPLSLKYQIVEKLWRHYGPSSRKHLRVGLDADLNAVVGVVRNHIEQVIVHHSIPERLEQKFNWLAAGDVHVKQQLLGHLRHRERSLVVQGAQMHLPVMMNHMREHGDSTHHIVKVLNLGKHELEVVIDKTFSGIRLSDPPVRTPQFSRSLGTSDNRWLWWVIGIALVIGLVFMMNSGKRR